jgi:D-alanyl-D-alanine carboxypeptidase
MQAGDPTKVVTVPDLSLDVAESQIGLFDGEQLQRDTLLRAMMIVSANDAAAALAVDIGGSEAQFVTMMNDAAGELGLDGTTAVNASGLDATGAGSTARDLIELTDLLMQDQTFRATVARRDARLHGQTFPATNELLGTYAGADGVKTGSTTQGGYSVVASATREGRSIAVAVLGSSTDDSRFDAAAELLDWAFTQL